MKKVVLWLFLFFLLGFLFISENSFCKEEHYLVKVELKAKSDLDIIRISAFDTTYFRKYCQAGLAALANLAMPYFDLRGDVNLDMKVSVSDVVFLINYLLKGGSAPSFPSLADVDCSGEIEISDVVYLINYLFKGGPPPAC